MTQRTDRRPLKYFLLATLAVGASASLFTEPSIPTWYAGLAKPSFTPPDWLFAPVWTLLYAGMAIAAWRVWRQTGWLAKEIFAFWIQLALNFGWSAVFFGFHQMGWAVAEIAALWLAVLATLVLFVRRDLVAGAIFAAYLAWVSFAALLTVRLWQLNS